MSSLTFRPSRPPWLFTSLAHSSYPFWNARPSAVNAPSAGVSDSEAPMVIGPVELLAGVVPLVVPLVVPELVQAASTLTPSTTAALVAIVLPVNLGRTRLTASSSFLLDHASSAGNHRARPSV